MNFVWNYSNLEVWKLMVVLKNIRLSSTNFLSRVLSGEAPVSPGAVLIRTTDLLKQVFALQDKK